MYSSPPQTKNTWNEQHVPQGWCLPEVHLKAFHVTYRTLDGTIFVAARDKAVKDFNTVPEVCILQLLAYEIHNVFRYMSSGFDLHYWQVTVMIMSLKAASLGLNMVSCLPCTYAISLVELDHRGPSRG